MKKKKTTKKKMTPTQEIVALKSVIVFMLSCMRYNKFFDRIQHEAMLERLEGIGTFKYEMVDFYKDMGEEPPKELPF